MVSVIAFTSDDPSSVPAAVYNFSVKLLLKRAEKTKKGRGWPILKKVSFDCWASLIEVIFLLVLLSTKNQQNAETIFGVKV